jgi:DNA repair exonuclease SbcCD ATPase subunit
MKLSKIIVDGMHRTVHAEYDFSNLTYFTGRNGAGKSTILQAIQYALLGYFPNGGKTKDAIFAHSNGSKMSVKLIFDNGFELCRSIERVKSKLVETLTPEGFEAESLIGNIILPILNYSEFVTMTANKLKDWYIGFLPTADGDISLSAQMDTVVRQSGINQLLDNDFVLQHTYEASRVPTTLENVRQFNDKFKEELSGYKSELARIQHTIQSLVFYDDCDMSASIDDIQLMISANQDKVSEMRKIAEHLRYNNSCSANIARYQADILSDYDLEMKSSRLSALQGNVSLKKSRMQDSEKRLVELQVKDKSVSEVIAGDGICPYQRDRCQTIVGLIQKMKTERDEMRQEICILRSKLHDDEMSVSADTAEIKALQNELAKHSSAQQRIQEIRNGFFTDCADYDIDGVTELISDLEKQQHQYSDQIAQIKANNRYNQLVSQMEAEKYKTEQCIEILKLWIKLTDVNGLQSQIMRKPFENFAAKMSDILSGFYENGVEAHFHITEKANDFSFGVIRDSQYVEYDHLSSGEKCIYTFAMLIAMTKCAAPQLPVVMIDDFLDHLDDEMVEKCFKTLSNINDVQIIIAGVKPCESAKAYMVEVQR